MKTHVQSLLISGAVLLALGMPLQGRASETGIENAATLADREALALRYDRQAETAQGKADVYRREIEWYQIPGNGNYTTVKGGRINHLHFLVRKYGDAARTALELAEGHRRQ